MFILRDIIIPLKNQFSSTQQGKKRSILFAYTLMAIITPFTSSKTSHLLRSLQVLFGLDLVSQRFYAFMASSTLPWHRLRRTLWSLIPQPDVDNRIIIALDDSNNPKTGRSIFGCGHFHDHAAKDGQSSYPWSQCILMIGLLKKVHQRWVCIPMDFRFYFMAKDIESNAENCRIKKKAVKFQTKMQQAATLLNAIHEHFQLPVLVVADSWFGNDGLWSKLGRGDAGKFQLLARFRSNITLYDLVKAIDPALPKQRGRPKKYGDRLGSVAQCAEQFRHLAMPIHVFLYSKKRLVSYYSQIVMVKTMKCPVRIVWVYRQTRYVPLITTDLSLSIEQIIEYYGARWKIESGFKEIKRDIGSASAQVRTPDAVINHLNFCMMATAVTWIYADHLQKAPDRRHKIKGRSSFAFSDVRRIISEVALDPDFRRLCPAHGQTQQKSFISALLRMVA